MTSLEGVEILWPLSARANLVESLLASSGHPIGTEGISASAFESERELIQWFRHGARVVGVEGVETSVAPVDLFEALLPAGPHVVIVPVGTPAAPSVYLLGVVTEGAGCRVLLVDGSTIMASVGDVAKRVCALLHEGSDAIRRVFASLPGGPAVFERLAQRERLDALPLSVVSYRLDGASPILAQIGSAGGNKLLAWFVALTLLRIGLLSVAALTLGQAAVDGIVDRGRVLAWAMISLASVPLTFWTTRAIGTLSVLGGMALKKRALEGAFFLGEDELRRQGYGATLARLNEAAVVERTSIAEVFGLIVPAAGLIAMTWLFAISRQPAAFLLVESVMIVIGVYAIVKSARTYALTYRHRLGLTEQVVDKVIGHRTRAAQEHPSRRHGSEDKKLLEYATGLRVNDSAATLVAILPRLWIVLSGGVLVYYFVVGAPAQDLVLPAIGLYLGVQAFTALGAAAERAVVWMSSWQAIESLVKAGRRRERARHRVETDTRDQGAPTVLAASGLAFSYRKGGRAVLREASIRIAQGDRVLIEGPSGGGKSTLAKLVAGELRPQGGSLLVSGLDPFTTSEAQWRELVASAPQFHENYVFSGTFAFNVDPKRGIDGLSGEAGRICEELDLGHVLRRMPAGGSQLLGETGWQLSHGERSRLFIARALLQKSELVIFDESFAALDPVTLKLVVGCVRRRAKTLIVIAHV